MIRLHRSDLSTGAQRRLDQRSAEYLDRLTSGSEIPGRLADYYRNAAEIKDRLRKSTTGKCMYCESHITHVYFGDVEHILPKMHFPKLRLVYSNLGFCCAICNNNKRAHFNVDVPLIDPYSTEPSVHLEFKGPSLRPLTDEGEATITILKLNREELILRRHECFEKLDTLVRAYQWEGNPQRQAILEVQLRQEWDSSLEYSMVRKSHILSETGITG
jgi:5-methylcytosine-specific restriction endonuclease McrA